MSTLADLVANNTSASSLYDKTGTGNATPVNISQVAPGTLLPVGATTKFYTHFQGWFWLKSDGSFGSHRKNVDVHYSDGKAGTGYNATQLGAQLDDMVRRGLHGVILDWYGPAAKTTSPNSDSTAAGLAALCAARGLEFAICIDQGGVDDVAVHEGVTHTAAFKTCIDYVNTTYYGNAAYMKKGGVPVLFFFPPGNTKIYDWGQIRTELLAQGNPIFVSEGKSAYSIVNTADGTGAGTRVCQGAFSWVNPGGTNTGDLDGVAYINDFLNYYVGKGFHLFASPIKGFNDDLTNGIIGDGIGNWGGGAVRLVSQNDGNTWLNRWAAIKAYMDAGNPLENIQFPTWDDYEEGSELETGIATSLVFTSLTVSGTSTASSGFTQAFGPPTLTWTVTGNTALVDHYEVWGATDGVNFSLQGTSLTTTFGLGTLGFGTWTLTVRAVGKPFVQNKLSGTAMYVNNPPPPPPPELSLGVTKTSFLSPNPYRWTPGLEGLTP